MAGREQRALRTWNRSFGMPSGCRNAIFRISAIPSTCHGQANANQTDSERTIFPFGSPPWCCTTKYHSRKAPHRAVIVGHQQPLKRQRYHLCMTTIRACPLQSSQAMFSTCEPSKHPTAVAHAIPAQTKTRTPPHAGAASPICRATPSCPWPARPTPTCIVRIGPSTNIPQAQRERQFGASQRET